ncbi:MAG: hypothetical protein IJI45_11350 [Anaerolineaceae bacterium]|nr:hypothetical protein [Anaerolineaceae bacterium]
MLTDNFTGFGTPNEQTKVRFQTGLMKKEVFKELSESQENVMERIAGSLAGAEISFMLKKSYTIEFMNDKPEYEEMKKEAESLVNTFGKEQVVFSN